jgi:hypothetical protein
MNWALTLTITLYALGLMHSVYGFYRKRQVFTTLALFMLDGGFASHTFYLIQTGLQLCHLPITNFSESRPFLPGASH